MPLRLRVISFLMRLSYHDSKVRRHVDDYDGVGAIAKAVLDTVNGTINTA